MPPKTVGLPTASSSSSSSSSDSSSSSSDSSSDEESEKNSTETRAEVPTNEAKQRDHKLSPNVETRKKSFTPTLASCYFCTRCNVEFDLRLELKAHMKEGCNLAEFSKATEEAEFSMYFELLSNSNITIGEEKHHLVSLIKKRRKFLIKRLVLQMTGLGMGRSKVFKSLSAQYLKCKEDKTTKE